MKHITIFSIGTLCLSACLVAKGQEGERKPGADRAGEYLKRADTNADGKISKEEMTALSKRDIDERFTKMDANGDGFIDQTEVAAIGERMREGMRNRGEGGRPGAPSGEGGFRRPPGESPPPEGARRPEGDRPGPRPEGDRPAGGPPPGGPGGGAMLDEVFGRMDKNSDGSIDKEEYAEFAKQESEQRFTRMDENTDGKVSKDEMKAGFEKLRGMMRGPGGPGGPPGEGGFRRPGGPEGGQGGFRRPPSEGGKGRPRPEAEGEEPKKKDAA